MKRTAGTRAAAVVVESLKPSIYNGEPNHAIISTTVIEGKDWLLFSLDKDSALLYYGNVWVLPGTPDGGVFTDARGDRYSYASDGLFIGPHVKVLPGAVAVDNGDTGYRGYLDVAGSEFTFAGRVNLLHLVISSDEKQPLVFKLVKDIGAVYVSGAGTVVTDDGRELVKIPAAFKPRSAK